MPLTRPRRSSATRSTGQEEDVSAATDIINIGTPNVAKPTPLEKAEAYASLLEEKEDGKPVYSERTLAKALKVHLSDIDNHLSILKAPAELKEALVEDPDIPARIIRELSAIQDAERRKRILLLYRSDALKYDDVFSITREIKKEQGPKGNKVTTRSVSAATDVTLQNEQLADIIQGDPLVGRKVLERKVKKANKTFYGVLTPLAEEIRQLPENDRNYVLEVLEDWVQKIRATVEQVPL